MHGNPENTFALIANYWSVYLGTKILPSDVAIMMVLFKIARESQGKFNPDNFVDAAGYIGLAYELTKVEVGATQE